MNIRKFAALGVAVAVPAGMVVTLGAAGVASAKAPPDTGTISCAGTSTTAILSVPYVPGGTVAKKSTTSLPGVAFNGCTHTGNTVTSGASAATVIKSKYPKGTHVDNCSTFLTSPPAVGGFKLAIAWGDGTKSKILISGGTGVTSPPSFVVNGTVVSGSFAGKSVAITALVDGPTVAALGACLGGNPTPVGTLGLTTSIAIS